MYYNVIKHSGHLGTLEKCRKHSPAARVFYISLVFSNARRVLSQCNTRLRLLYLLNKEMGNKKLGRPFVYKTEEEEKAALRRKHTKSMGECKWYCEACQREYSLGAKYAHLMTTKHSRNYYKNKPLIEI